MTSGKQKQDIAAADVQARTAVFLDKVIQETGLPPSLVLVGAFNSIVTMLAGCYGPDEAATFCQAAADKLDALPCQGKHDLANTPPLGSA